VEVGVALSIEKGITLRNNRGEVCRMNGRRDDEKLKRVFEYCSLRLDVS
jgi:hypothetical protein